MLPFKPSGLLLVSLNLGLQVLILSAHQALLVTVTFTFSRRAAT